MFADMRVYDCAPQPKRIRKRMIVHVGQNCVVVAFVNRFAVGRKKPAFTVPATGRRIPSPMPTRSSSCLLRVCFVTVLERRLCTVIMLDLSSTAEFVAGQGEGLSVAQSLLQDSEAVCDASPFSKG